MANAFLHSQRHLHHDRRFIALVQRPIMFLYEWIALGLESEDSRQITDLPGAFALIISIFTTPRSRNWR